MFSSRRSSYETVQSNIVINSATFLLIGVLVFGVGLPPAVPQVDQCSWSSALCCMYIHVAQVVCDTFGNGSWICQDYIESAIRHCADAAELCNGTFSTHECFP